MGRPNRPSQSRQCGSDGSVSCVRVRIVVRPDPLSDEATMLLQFGNGGERAVLQVADEVVARHDYWHGVLDERGRFAISAYALDGVDEGDIAREMPHRFYGRSTVGRVRRAGFDLVGSTIEFDRMPAGLRRVQQWHTSVFLRIPGLVTTIAEDPSATTGVTSTVRDEIATLFGLFERTPNSWSTQTSN